MAAVRFLNNLSVKGTGTVLDIQGTQGQLFSITDSLTGDLFSVSDISGVPILNVNSSGAITIDGTLTSNGQITGTELEGTSLDINGNADISGNITNAGWTGDVIASAYLDTDTAHLTTTQTFSGSKTFSALASFTMDGNTITGVDDSGEFTDDDSHIMTSAAVNDRIQASIIANTDTQDLSISGQTLSLTNGGSVTLPTQTSVSGNAGTVTNGVYTTGDQTIGGIKEFTSEMKLGTYNSTVGGILSIHGTTANKKSTIKTTNGNLHVDSADGHTLYLNYYTGASGTNANVNFGNGDGGASGAYVRGNGGIVGTAINSTGVVGGNSLDINGNADISGNLTGVDTLTATTFSGNLNGTINTATTAVTQSASNNSTKVATTAYVDAQVATVVDSAPGTLNTLNELAAALGDDASFSTTVTNSIAAKLPLAGGTMSGAIAMGNQNITGAGTITGTTLTGTSLDINGNADISGTLKINSVYTANTDANDLQIGSTNTGNGGLSILTGNTNTGGIFFGDNDNNDAGRIKYIHSSNSLLFDTNRTNALTLDTSQNATFAGNGTFETTLNVSATDSGGSPAMTAIMNMHGYDQRGVGIKMKDNKTTSGGGTDAEWFVGTGYNSTGFNIGYASDGSQSSYPAQAKLAITTAGNATFAGTIGSGAITSTGKITGTELEGTSLDINGNADISGTLDVHGNMSLYDNNVLRFGNGNDLQIFHDSNHSYIKDAGTGHLQLLSSQLQINNAGNTENMITAAEDGAVTLFNNGNAKLATKSDGVDITGELQCDTLDVDGNADISGTTRFGNTVTIVGTNSTNAESVLLRGISSNDGDWLGSIRTANTGGYNQEMRFYTSNADGTSDEDLTLTLKPDQSATFAGNITAGANSVTAGSFIIGGHTISDVNVAGEFNDVDTKLMTAAAINDRIQASIIANTDTQDLSISGQTLSLTNGGSVTLPDTNTVDMGSGFIVANNGGTSQFTIVEDNALRFAGTGATTVAFNSATKKVTIDSTNTVYTHPTNLAGDDIDIDTGALTGATVISDLDFNITTNTAGHVTDANATVATRNLTLANLGYSVPTTVSGSSGSCTGNAATATLAATSTIASDTGSATHFPVFVDSSTGSRALKAHSAWNYNPGTSTLTAGKLTTDTAAIVENAKSNAALMTLTGAGAGNEANITLKLAGTVHGSPVKMKMVAETTGGDPTGNGLLSYNPDTDTFGIGQTTTHNSMAILIDNSDVVSMKNQTTFTNGIDVTSGVNSTSKTTGTVKIAGGLGVVKTLNVGEDVVAYASSDERYKDNLKPITNSIDKVKSLTGYTFTWNDKHEQFNGNDDIGVVAQEVEKVLPEIVDTRDNGYKAVKYEKMVALLIEAVKDQQKQIDELKAMINGNS